MRSNHPIESFYIPLLMAIAAVFVGVALPELHIKLSSAEATVLNALAVILILAAAVLAYRALKLRTSTDSRGGRGGNATSIGDANKVSGGRGGSANGGTGGAGGNATARGNRSVVKGGKGGAG
jgi:hypothetical protein